MDSLGSRHQGFATLNGEVCKCVAESRSSCGPGDLPIRDEKHDLWKNLARILVSYASYQSPPARDTKVDPFDDPYVGAMLLSTDGVLLSAHRKERRHEKHAEVMAMLGALE